jgi:hypothetical protein
MKKIYLLALSGIISIISVNAQTPCATGRYSTSLFSNVTVTSDINFGSNTSTFGVLTQLDLDVYEPTGDTETARPLIIWAHGGSFIGGSKNDADVVTLSEEFAKKGYVCASIEYRLGMFPVDSSNAIMAVLRAVQDMKAAIRFFYKDRATTNTYKIDTTRIFVGGSSAGAITALHLAYLDKDCEIEPYIPLATLNGLGGMEGDSGNPGYSSDVVGVINLAGALASYGWIESGDIPLCSMHGDLDGTVPYNRDYATVSGFNIMILDGSRMLQEQADAVGVQNQLYTHYNADHAVYAFSTQYMDTTINFVRDFLIDQLGCTDAELQPANAPSGVANLYNLNYCDLGIGEDPSQIVAQIYPNPSNDEVNVVFNEGEIINSVTLTDLSGRIIDSFAVNSGKLILYKNKLKAGTYILHAINNNGITSTNKIIFQ